MNLCHLGADKIDVYLKYAEKDYYLYTYIARYDGFYIDKGSTFTIITIKSDTINLRGLYEGAAEITDHSRNMMHSGKWTFLNKYQLDTNQIKILKTTEIRNICLDVANYKLKMDVTTLRDQVLMELFSRIDKKIKND